MMKLRQLKQADIDGMLDWMHDPKVNKYFRFNAANATRDTVDAFIKEAQVAANNNSDYHFAIVNDDDEYMGTVSLKHIDNEKKEAEYAIAVRSKFHHMGVGSFATKSILDFAFNELNLESVYLNVLSENTGAKKLYEKMGFVVYMHESNAVEINGDYKDLYWYRINKKSN